MPNSKNKRSGSRTSSFLVSENAQDGSGNSRASHHYQHRSRSHSRSLSRRSRSGSVATSHSQALSFGEEEEDFYLAEPASEEIFSGPVSESVPSAYSAFHHRRYSSKHQDIPRRDSSVSRHNADNEAPSSVSSGFGFMRTSSFSRDAQSSLHSAQPDDEAPRSRRGSIGSIDSHTSFSRHRADSFSTSASFRFFSKDEIEQAEGASTVPNEVDPVEYEVLRRVTENEEQLPEETVLDFITATPHQHPYRYSYEESSVLLRHQAEIEFARESVEFEREENEEEPEPIEEEITDDVVSSRRFRRHSSDFFNRWHGQASNEPLLSRIHSQDSHERKPTTYNSSNKQQRFYISEEDMLIFIAGYNSTKWRAYLYYMICICTLGIAYLLLRWVPRWHIACLGSPAPLGQCDWVVVENQWGEISVIDVKATYFNRPLSQVFRTQESEDNSDSANENSSPQGQSESNSSGNQTHHDEDVQPFVINEDLEDPILHTLRIIEYRYIKFFYHPDEDIFLTNYDWVDPGWSSVAAVREGIDSDSQGERKEVFGPNVIDIEEKTTMQLLVDEVLHPFYIFQVFSMILWSLDEYYYYATCIFIISVISVGNALIETKQTLSRLREVARFVADIRVLRSGYWITVPSTELVPGDIFEVSDPSISVFPCDSLLLSGDCVVNESMLTGESVPVSKYPVNNQSLDEFVNGKSTGSSVSAEIAKHFLYSGTKVVQVRKPVPKRSANGNINGSNSDSDQQQLDVAVALVVRTGFMTTKGALVRSMLFPKPSGFKFYQDSFKYIGVMACVAIFGFLHSVVNFVKMGMSTKLIVFRALDLITIVVPPALPATLTIGTNISLSRLREKKIFCISPSRVNVGGKLDVVCFDKTGTLTEDGLDVLGVHVQENGRFSDLLQTAEEVFPYENLALTDSESIVPNGKAKERNNLKGSPKTYPYPSIEQNHKSRIQQRSSIIAALTTCHQLRKIDDELLGDPLDHKMFSFTNWNFDEEIGATLFASDFTHENPVPVVTPPVGTNRFSSSGNTLGTVASFDFVPRLRRMSVLIKALGSSGQNDSSDIFAYVKGAPEIMPDVCDITTFPENYDELLYQYTHRGYRVIACATKVYKNMDAHEARKLSRNEVERDLQFLGFIVFENRLKPSTTRAIEQLNAANIRTIMCTGDNVLTAISVAKECVMVNEHTRIFVPRFESVPDGVSPEDFNPITWEYIDDRSLTLDSVTLQPTIEAEGEHYRVYGKQMQYALAVTGDAFRYIVQFGSDWQLEHVLMKGAIFARMSPDEKHELVEKLQSLDYTTGFCGDGANDVGALKAADVGISLSEAEASVAAPFTSQIFEISCVLDVIAEGRSALVTSFSCFKYMSLYSAIQFVTVSILYSLGSNLGDFQFLWIDLFLILPIAIFMAWSKPYHTLAIKRPSANLVSSKVLVPLLGQIGILAFFQYFIWQLCRKESYYVPPIMGGDDSEVDSTDNTSLFIFSCYQYIFVSILLTVGPPYHEPVIKNKPFVFTIIGTCLLTFGFMVVPPFSWFGQLMNLMPLSSGFKLILTLTILLNFTVSKIFDDFIFTPVAYIIRKVCVLVGIPAKTKSSKLYKRIKKDMEHEKEV